MRLVIILASAGWGESTGVLKTEEVQKMVRKRQRELTWKQKHPRLGQQLAWQSRTRNQTVGHTDPFPFLGKRGILVDRDARQPFNHSYRNEPPNVEKATNV